MAYTVTPNIPLNMPTPGTREPAQIALLNENAVQLSNHDHTNGKALAVGRLRSGLNANRPAAGTAGNVYFATDTGAFYVDTGTAWVQFITSGGQATVTGWTLIDPVVRDTIQWGPEGSGTIDATLTRIAAGKFQLAGTGTQAWVELRAAGSTGGARLGQPQVTSGLWIAANADYNGTQWVRDDTSKKAWHLSMVDDLLTVYSVPAGANPAVWNPRLFINEAGNMSLATVGPKPTWVSSYRNIQIGIGATLIGPTDLSHLFLNANVYHNGTAWKAINAGGAGMLQVLSTGVLQFFNAPSVAADANLSITSRLTLDQAGNMMVGSGSPGAWGSAFKAVQVGGGCSLWGNDGAAGVWLTSNSIFNGTNRVAYQGGTIGFEMTLGSGGWTVVQYPAVAAGAAQTPTTRMAISTIGTLTLTPDANQVAITSGGWSLTNSALGDANSVLFGAGTYVAVNPGANYFLPSRDGAINCGSGAQRWGTMFAVVGSINTSHVSMKEHFEALDPSACAQAVLDTQWWEFDYKAPAPPERPEQADDEQWRLLQENHEKSVAETADSRHARGYVLGSPDHAVSDLFGVRDRKSGAVSSDLAVVACALQSALQRIAALEAKNATAA